MLKLLRTMILWGILATSPVLADTPADRSLNPYADGISLIAMMDEIVAVQDTQHPLILVAAVVPEPSSFAALVGGMLTLGLVRVGYRRAQGPVAGSIRAVARPRSRT